MPRGKVGGKYDRRMSFDDVKDERMLVMVDKLCVWLGGILNETLNRENLIPQIRHVYNLLTIFCKYIISTDIM